MGAGTLYVPPRSRSSPCVHQTLLEEFETRLGAGPSVLGLESGLWVGYT